MKRALFKEDFVEHVLSQPTPATKKARKEYARLAAMPGQKKLPLVNKRKPEKLSEEAKFLRHLQNLGLDSVKSCAIERGGRWEKAAHELYAHETVW